MPTYKYKVASSSGGEARTVSIEAETKEEALEKLRMKGLVPIKFAGVANTSGFASLMGRGTFDQVDFTKRLLPLLKAQIPIEKALGIITDGSDDEPTKLVVSDLRKGLHEGKKFSALIREKNNVFSSIYANMVEAGEESGSLVEVMEELRKFLQARKELKTFLATS
jgi:general secretion pathway protein F